MIQLRSNRNNTLLHKYNNVYYEYINIHQWKIQLMSLH
jgi:hypothetical protein